MLDIDRLGAAETMQQRCTFEPLEHAAGLRGGHRREFERRILQQIDENAAEAHQNQRPEHGGRCARRP